MTQSNTRSKKRINRRKTKRMNRGGNNLKFDKIIDEYIQKLPKDQQTKIKKNEAIQEMIKKIKEDLKEIEKQNYNIKDIDAFLKEKLSKDDQNILTQNKMVKEMIQNVKAAIIANNSSNNDTPAAPSSQKPTNQNECPSNKDIFDAFIKDLHQSYFKQGVYEEPNPNYSIDKKHNIKIKLYPSSFSTEENPVHFYSKITDDITYGNWWEQYIMDAWAIDDMIHLVNLQQYNHDPYKGDENGDEKREKCSIDSKNKEDKDDDEDDDDEYDEEKKKELDKCDTYKKYKKYKHLSKLKNNTIKDFSYEDNYKIHKIMTPP